MYNMIHEIFKDIPNEDMAVACSETATSNAFTFITDPWIKELYGPHGFPPVPAHMSSVVATYIEGDPRNLSARMQYLNMTPELISNTKVGDMYAETVGTWQKMVPIIESLVMAIPEFGRSLEGMQEWCVRKTAQEGRRLVVAHHTSIVEHDGKAIDALVVPKVIVQELPLVFRDSAIAILPQLKEVANSGLLVGISEADLVKALGPMLRAEKVSSNLPLIALASLLPKVEPFRSAIKDAPTREPVQGSKPAESNSGLREDRAARRRREREEVRKPKKT